MDVLLAGVYSGSANGLSDGFRRWVSHVGGSPRFRPRRPKEQGRTVDRRTARSTCGNSRAAHGCRQTRSAPSAALRTPQPHPATADAAYRAVSRPEEADEPARRKTRSSLAVIRPHGASRFPRRAYEPPHTESMIAMDQAGHGLVLADGDSPGWASRRRASYADRTGTPNERSTLPAADGCVREPWPSSGTLAGTLLDRHRPL
jgi:hypothetical protein